MNHQVNQNLGLEIVSTLKYADSGVGELLHSPVKSSKPNMMTKDNSATSKDTNEWSKRLAGPETSSAAETVGIDLNQELDKLEMVGTTKRILGVNHDGINQKQWNKIEMWESSEISCKASTSKPNEEGIDSQEFDWVDTDDCPNIETILEVVDYETNNITNDESES